VDSLKTKSFRDTSKKKINEKCRSSKLLQYRSLKMEEESKGDTRRKILRADEKKVYV
jgi:hypothetical protein